MIPLERFNRALRAALQRPELADDAARCNASIMMRISDASQAEGARKGSLESSKADSTLTLWPGLAPGSGPLIELSAPSHVWEQVFCALPPPGRQSLGALRRQCSDFSLQGEALAVAQALPFMERLLQALREALHESQQDGLHEQQPTPAPYQDSKPPAHLEGLRHIRGRYLPLGSSPLSPWVYAEQAGVDNGPALLMLHTAGADARQWHGLMAQAPLREQWSLHAFDLPAHGRSPLPAGQANWLWRLTEQQYIAWVLAYLDAAQLERVVLMGCSMGSAIGLALLARHPERFAGAVLLEMPYRSPGRRSPYLNHPEVHSARLGAAWVGSLLSPSSPRANREQATWIYSQAAPGIYDGDLAFYSDDFDAHQHTAQIDTHRTPLFLLTGNYDYSATPDDSRRVAAEIPGSHFVELPGFGHFPMVENPVGLMPHLEPALKALQASLRAS